MWIPQGAPEHYNDFYIALDLGVPSVIKAILW
jgi:hypothetical protein